MTPPVPAEPHSSNTSRRDLLKRAAALAGAGAVLGSPALGRLREGEVVPIAKPRPSLKDDDPVRVGLIGTGGMGGGHIDAFLSFRQQGEVNLDLVPRRETEMSPYEVLLSESQERMLIVVAAGREAEVRAIFERYELHAVAIGHVTDEPLVRCFARGELVCEVPGRALTDDAPRYVPPAAPPRGDVVDQSDDPVFAERLECHVRPRVLRNLEHAE